MADMTKRVVTKEEEGLVEFKNLNPEGVVFRTTKLQGKMSQFQTVNPGDIVKLPRRRGLQLGLTPVSAIPESK